MLFYLFSNSMICPDMQLSIDFNLYLLMIEVAYKTQKSFCSHIHCSFNKFFWLIMCLAWFSIWVSIFTVISNKSQKLYKKKRIFVFFEFSKMSHYFWTASIIIELINAVFFRRWKTNLKMLLWDYHFRYWLRKIEHYF